MSLNTLNCDCLIIGGGVIGLTTALKLAEQGASVAVLERGRVGQEASWAGAGMLPPGNLPMAETAEARLRSLSHSLWADLTQSLAAATGIDNGYRVCGSTLLSQTGGTSRHEICEHASQATAAHWQAEGIRCEVLDRRGIEQHAGRLHDSYQSGLYLPDYAQVRNPRHLKALKTACLSRGVRLKEQTEGLQILSHSDRVRGVSWFDGRGESEAVCVTAGAWTGNLLASLNVRLPVAPVRGQIVQLRSEPLPFRCILEVGRRYLVPRSDGLILIGSTEENVGFQKQNTADGVTGLLQFAGTLAPALRDAEVMRTWAGLRPGSPDELPIIGRVPGFQNLFVGAGHFRSGLQMSPGTAALLVDLIQGRTPVIPVSDFACDRFSAAERTDEIPPALES